MFPTANEDGEVLGWDTHYDDARNLDDDPTPQERWQVTTPDEVYWNGED